MGINILYHNFISMIQFILAVIALSFCYIVYYSGIWVMYASVYFVSKVKSVMHKSTVDTVMYTKVPP